MIAVAEAWAADAEAKQIYGHIWRAVETFFMCVVLEGVHLGNASAAPPLRKIFVPSRHEWKGDRYALFRELAELFTGPGSRMHVSRAPSVPACPGLSGSQQRSASRQCCLNATVRSSIRGAHGKETRFAELMPQRPEVPDGKHVHARAMRHVVWANLGVESAPADLVLFVSNEGASNNRHIVNEAELASALRIHFGRVRPSWRFRYQRLESLSYSNEVRLMRRARVLISLFGSALHNCHFLDPSALVIQIHGALKGEIQLASASMYRDICARQLGLAWVGYAVPGWNCSFYDWQAAKVDCAGAPGIEDMARARVQTVSFIRVIDLALANNLSMLHREYEHTLGFTVR